MCVRLLNVHACKTKMKCTLDRLLVLGVVGELGPSSEATLPPEDAAVGDAGVWAAATPVEGETLRPGHRLRQRHHDESRIYGLGFVR